MLVTDYRFNMTPDKFIRDKYRFSCENLYELDTQQWLESMTEYAEHEKNNGVRVPGNQNDVRGTVIYGTGLDQQEPGANR